MRSQATGHFAPKCVVKPELRHERKKSPRKGERQRRFIIQPRVARRALPWVNGPPFRANPGLIDGTPLAFGRADTPPGEGPLRSQARAEAGAWARGMEQFLRFIRHIILNHAQPLPQNYQ
jgi:hypothetical protein